MKKIQKTDRKNILDEKCCFQILNCNNIPLFSIEEYCDV